MTTPDKKLAAARKALKKQPPCCICGLPIDVQGTWHGGHNAEPIKAGRCCTHCERTIVLPARITNLC